MTKPTTDEVLDRYWLEDFSIGGLCCLCGNSGIVDTRGKVPGPMGRDAGARVFCFCPNGRAAKRFCKGELPKDD
jgi:hypothetical protein